MMVVAFDEGNVCAICGEGVKDCNTCFLIVVVFIGWAEGCFSLGDGVHWGK